RAGGAHGPAQIGRGRKDGAHRVLAVTAVAVDMPPLPSLVDGVRHEQAVTHRVPRSCNRLGRPPPRRPWAPRHGGRSRDPGADQAAPHEMLRPHVPSPWLVLRFPPASAATGAYRAWARCTVAGSR